MSAALMDPAVAAERYPHGTRARYVLAGCRCFPCRVATTNYETERQAERRKPRRVHYVQERREWIVRHRETGVIEFRSADRDVVYRKLRELNGQELEESLRELIGTRAVREHLRWLSGVGVGYKTVARASGVASSVVFKIHTGAIRRTRRGTAELLGDPAPAVAELKEAIEEHPRRRGVDDRRAPSVRRTDREDPVDERTEARVLAPEPGVELLDLSSRGGRHAVALDLQRGSLRPDEIPVAV